MAKEKDETQKKYTLDDLRTIVAAGMAVGEARLLLEEGYDPADVMELAQMQASQRKDAATEAQQATAKAMQKAMRPENEMHPGISAFSKPGGDVANHQDRTFPYEVWYLNYPMHMFPETETWRELELAKKVEPGEYTILLKDETTMRWVVTCERDGNGTIKKLYIGLPDGGKIDREGKWLIPAKSVVLYQMVYAKSGSPKRVYLKAMQDYLMTTFDEPEAVSA